MLPWCQSSLFCWFWVIRRMKCDLNFREVFAYIFDHVSCYRNPIFLAQKRVDYLVRGNAVLPVINLRCARSLNSAHYVRIICIYLSLDSGLSFSSVSIVNFMAVRMHSYALYWHFPAHTQALCTNQFSWRLLFVECLYCLLVLLCVIQGPSKTLIASVLMKGNGVVECFYLGTAELSSAWQGLNRTANLSSASDLLKDCVLCVVSFKFFYCCFAEVAWLFCHIFDSSSCDWMPFIYGSVKRLSRCLSPQASCFSMSKPNA